MRSSIPFSFVSTVLTLTAMGGCDATGAQVPAPGEGASEAPTTTAAPLTPSASVFVNNTSTQPVPTRAIGSTTVDGTVKAAQTGNWNVSVDGGTVAASQSGYWAVNSSQHGLWSVSQQGPWSMDVASMPPVALAPGSSVSVGAVGSLPPVTIAGTPAVQVVNTPAVTIANTPNVAVHGTVAIANTEDDEAVPVRIVGSGAGDGGGGGTPSLPTVTPWVVDGQVIIDAGEQFDSEQFATPPPGKRLVIEYVSISGSLPTGQVVSEATLLGTSVGSSATFRFNLTPWPKTHTSFDRFGVNERASVNVRNGAGVIVAVARGQASTGTGIFNVAISGYLVDE
jgi:hypothetical protein